MNLDQSITYIVGVSGGCDSMALVDLLRKENYQIVICHVDYGIRNDTDEDYRIVYGYAKKYNIPFFFHKVENYKNGNFQNQAREIRYQFFKDTGELFNTNHVLVAHHKDDIYETILLQKERDIQYLYLGLKEENEFLGCIVHRVFLNKTKQELIDYCHYNGLAYHDDYTNFETHYRRDYIRNVILKNMSEKDKEALLLEANRHNEVMLARKAYIESILQDQMNLEDIKEEDLDDVLYYMCSKKIPRVSKNLIDEIKECTKKSGNCKIDLPVNFEFIKEYNNITIQKKVVDEDYSFVFNNMEELMHFDCSIFHCEPLGHAHEGIGLSMEDFPITIRSFRLGDRMETKVGKKKVNRIYIDRKIPITKRRGWPIVLNSKGEIILIPHIMKNLHYFNVKNNIFVIKY